jgi:hypothetical protein
MRCGVICPENCISAATYDFIFKDNDGPDGHLPGFGSQASLFEGEQKITFIWVH